MDHLCASLGMTYESFRYLARIIVQSRGDPSDHPLVWSLEVVSTFYRLTKLPRYMGVTTIEALALIEILDNGPSQLTSRVAGITRIETHAGSAETDTLSVIHAWVDCVAWMQESAWQVAQLYPLLGARFTDIVASDAEHYVLDQINQRLQAALITDSSFAEIGAPSAEVLSVFDDAGQERQVQQAIDWFDQLDAFIDTEYESKGLIKHLGDNEPNFENALEVNVKKILTDLKLEDEALADKIINRVMRARAEQGALLMEGLSGYLGVSAEQADALLAWAQGNRYQLLKEVCRLSSGGNTIKVDIGDDVLWLLMQLSQRATITLHLHMSSAMIRQFVAQPEWFGLPDTRLSSQAIYILTQYATVVRRSEQSEDTLLDYIRLVNTYKGEEAGDIQLIRESAAQRLGAYLRWGIREVLAVGMYLDSDSGVIRSVPAINVVSRLALMGHQASLDARALLDLAALLPTSRVADYRDAAEQALSTLNSLMSPLPESEVGQSRAHTITVSRDYLIAKKPDERAVFTITLRSLTDEPLVRVTVHWEASLGRLDEDSVVTDGRGMASVTLDAEDEMGVAIVQVHFGLGETQKAPAVTIGFDKATVDFFDAYREPDSALANRLEPIIYSGFLKDEYGNLGIDHPVTWETTLGEFQRNVTLAGSQGQVRAELRSLSPSDGPKVIVVARCGNGNDRIFNAVQFTDEPYFQYVRFADAITVDCPVRVECRVVRIDGSPVQESVLVEWKTTNGEFESASTETDADGIVFALLSPATDDHVVVSVHSADVKADKSSEPTPVYPVTTLKLTVPDETYLIGAAPLVFSSELKVGDDPAVKRLVNWYVDEGPKPDSYTNLEGIAIFSSRFSLGSHEIKAVIAGTDVEARVPIEAVECEFECVLSGFFASRPGLLSRYETYTLTVKTIRRDSGVAVAGVPFVIRAKGVRELGVNIKGLGDPQVSTLDGVAFDIDFSAFPLHGVIYLEIESGGNVKWSDRYEVGYYYELGGVRVSQGQHYVWLIPHSSLQGVKPIVGVLEGGEVVQQILGVVYAWVAYPRFGNSDDTPDCISATFQTIIRPPVGSEAMIQGGSGLDMCFCIVPSSVEVTGTY